MLLSCAIRGLDLFSPISKLRGSAFSFMGEAKPYRLSGWLSQDNISIYAGLALPRFWKSGFLPEMDFFTQSLAPRNILCWRRSLRNLVSSLVTLICWRSSTIVACLSHHHQRAIVATVRGTEIAANHQAPLMSEISPVMLSTLMSWLEKKFWKFSLYQSSQEWRKSDSQQQL